uniref:Uncharacterized protein n=1 Tax=Pyramimonas obovata TaxID=1411642 RepID=A0A7S0MS72_9CHLO|mmetsp:Transcript_12164/g.25521  ORF Transcript_12164/g.25521 Transcript_12164/m.25521 type:complete len:312 (+) Transcript_12164:599-1534(+)
MLELHATVHNHTRQNVSVLQGVGGMKGRKTRAQVKPRAAASAVLKPTLVDRFFGRPLRAFYLEIKAESPGQNELVRVKCVGIPFEFVQTPLYVIEILKQVESVGGETKVVVAIHNANEFALCTYPKASLFEAHHSVSGVSLTSINSSSHSGRAAQDQTYIGSVSSSAASGSQTRPHPRLSSTCSLSTVENPVGCTTICGSFTNSGKKARSEDGRQSDPPSASRLLQVEDMSRLRQRSLARLDGLKSHQNSVADLKDLALNVEVYGALSARKYGDRKNNEEEGVERLNLETLSAQFTMNQALRRPLPPFRSI